MSKVLNRTLPSDIGAEKALLGAILLDNKGMERVSSLSPEDFTDKRNGMVFKAMQELENAKQAIDPITLVSQLKVDGAPEDILTTEYMKELMDNTLSSHISEYVGIVNDCSIRRKVIKVGETIASKATEADMDELLEVVEKEAFNVTQTASQAHQDTTLSDSIINVLKKIETASQTGNGITGLQTGFSDLDKLTHGLQPSKYILVAARPAMGKSAFAVNVAQYAAVKHGNPVGIISLEMGKDEIVERMISAQAEVDNDKLQTGNLTDKEWAKVTEASEIINSAPIYIHEGGSTIQEVKSQARRWKSEHDIKLLVIDYVQLIRTTGKENRTQEVSYISNELNALKTELHIPIIILSQLNRSVEQRAVPIPQMSDLRDSGSLEQDADQIFFLYREDYYNPDTDRPNVCDIIVGKNRGGRLQDFSLAWRPNLTKFTNIMKPWDEYAAQREGGVRYE